MVEPSLFPNRPPPPTPRRETPAAHAAAMGMQERLNELGSRIAVLEERAANLRKNGRLTEQSLISYDQETRAGLKALNERLTELARKVEEVHEKIDAISAELSGVAKRHEITVLERYLDLWQPLSFVTRDEAKLLLQDALAKRK